MTALANHHSMIRLRERINDVVFGYAAMLRQPGVMTALTHDIEQIIRPQCRDFRVTHMPYLGSDDMHIDVYVQPNHTASFLRFAYRIKGRIARRYKFAWLPRFDIHEHWRWLQGYWDWHEYDRAHDLGVSQI